MRYIYLHGFASGPGTRKGQYFKKRLAEEGVTLFIPDLNAGDFSHTTISQQLKVVRHLIEESEEPVVLLGSSLGGFLAALVAEQVPLVNGIFILAPGFDFYARRKHILGEKALEEWKRRGVLDVFHHHLQKSVPLHYEFVEDAKKYDGVTFTRPVPAWIIHGLEDDVVPFDASFRYLRENTQAQLILLHADHGMVEVLPVLWEYFQLFRRLLGIHR